MATRDLLTSFQTETLAAHEVAGFTLETALGRPARARVEVRLTEEADADELLGQACVLSFGRKGDADSEYVQHGIVAAVTVSGVTARADRASQGLVIEMVSEIGLLEGSFGSRIFQEMDVQEIVTSILEEHGVDGGRQEWQLGDSYPKREYCVQYQESALAFVSRLLEEEGIFYFAKTDGTDQEVFVFSDDSEQSAPIAGDKEVKYRGRIGMELPEDGIVEIEEHHRVRSGQFVLRDYDFKRPALDMTVTADAEVDTDLSVYDYPGLYVEPSEGERLATVRLEAEQVDRETVSIVADCTRLTVGHHLALTDTPIGVDGEYVIVEVEHALAAGGTAEIGQSRAKLLPLATKFRTEQSTPRPIIEGPQTARVVAPDGSEPETIHTDEHGRCKVKFHWDLAPPEDDKASCWMRVGQLQTSGSMILPRLDWEVIVEFEEGNPDRPLVTGKLYNGRFMPPYALPEGKTRTSLQTSVTPGGGGTNEIRFEDAAGSEEIMVHAHYDQNIEVANNKTKTVGNCETQVVGVDSSSTVGANETSKVTMGHRTTVGADQSVSVGGNRSVEVNAVTGMTSGGSSTTVVGGNHFEMDGNPLQGLLALAAERAIEFATAKAGEVMEQIDGAVQSRVDQVMGPVNALQSHAQSLQSGMDAIRGGDMGGAAGLLAGAAGVPVPSALSDAVPGLARPAATQAPGGGASTAGITSQLAVDQAVNNAIQQGIQGGANALSEAMGAGGGGGGGGSMDNVGGPEGDVGGISGEDRTKGPGHNLNTVSATHSETVGGMRVVAAVNGVMTNVATNLTENVGAAKVTMALGNIASSVEAVKSETVAGLVVVSRADESESVGGAKNTMVGGAVAEKIGGGHSIEAGAPATFVGAVQKIEAKGKITFSCGASELVIEGGGIKITSPMVTVTAGKIQLTKITSEV